MRKPELDDRLALTQAMAEQNGVALENEVSREAALRMARCCAACTQTDTCRIALISGKIRDIPGFCLNRETIEALASRR